MTYSNGFAAGARRRTVHLRTVGGAHQRGRQALFDPAAGYSRGSATYRRFVRRRSLRRIGATAAALLAVVAFASATWLAHSSASAHDGGAPDPSSNAPQSTPKSDWHAGDVPKLYQRDVAWADARYGDDSFAESGCGPTCMAMVYIGLTGRNDLLPTDIGAISERMGCITPEGTTWSFMTEGAAQIGLSAEELPADEMSVRQALLGGSYVICSMGPGDFTTTGHFIVLVGIDENGKLIVRDPNSPERTNRTWSFDDILGQARNLWAYSAA